MYPVWIFVVSSVLLCSFVSSSSSARYSSWVDFSIRDFNRTFGNDSIFVNTSIPSESTTIPNFRGSALYNPNAIEESSCIINSAIQRQLDLHYPNTSMLQTWLSHNHHLICDFTKFHTCIPTSVLFKDYEGDTVQTYIENPEHDDSLGACRCFLPQFTLLADTCFISAGSSYDCSTTEPYPVILPWHNASLSPHPLLHPQCIPGSTCISSVCQCSAGYQLHKTSGTCIDVDTLTNSASFISPAYHKHLITIIFTILFLLSCSY